MDLERKLRFNKQVGELGIIGATTKYYDLYDFYRRAKSEEINYFEGLSAEQRKTIAVPEYSILNTVRKQMAKNDPNILIPKVTKARCFTPDEDKRLNEAIVIVGKCPGKWNAIAKLVGGGKTARQCRDRLYNYLSPKVTENWTEEEDELLKEKRKEFGTKWSKYKDYFPNRLQSNIKGRYYYLIRMEEKRWLPTNKNQNPSSNQNIDVNTLSNQNPPSNQNITVNPPLNLNPTNPPLNTNGSSTSKFNFDDVSWDYELMEQKYSTQNTAVNNNPQQTMSANLGSAINESDTLTNGTNQQNQRFNINTGIAEDTYDLSNIFNNDGNDSNFSDFNDNEQNWSGYTYF